MMRQLGGSFGIAALTTMIHVRQGFHRSNLLVNVNEYNTAFTDRLNGFIRKFMAEGYTFLDAKALGIKAIEGTVTRQTMLLTYSDAYWIAGLVLLCSIPLLYLQKFKKNVEVPADLH